MISCSRLKVSAGVRISSLICDRFFPGTVYLLSTWYTRYEVGKRYSVFYLIGVVASAFGGILAFGLMQMEGVAGYGGWRYVHIPLHMKLELRADDAYRWIFIIEVREYVCRISMSSRSEADRTSLSGPDS